MRTDLWTTGGDPSLAPASPVPLHDFPHTIHTSGMRGTLGIDVPYELFHSPYHYESSSSKINEAVGEVDT
jgi:hypothetical protein